MPPQKPSLCNVRIPNTFVQRALRPLSVFAFKLEVRDALRSRVGLGCLGASVVLKRLEPSVVRLVEGTPGWIPYHAKKSLE